MIKSGLPTPAAPLVDPTGRIMTEWFLFLQALHQRTGGAAGVDAKVLASDVSSASDSIGLLLADDAGTVAAKVLQTAVTEARAAVADLALQVALNEPRPVITPDPLVGLLSDAPISIAADPLLSLIA